MHPFRLAIASACLMASTLSHSAAGNLADVVVYDRTARRELPVHRHEGKLYVVGRPGNEYQVTMRNRAGEDLLAVVSVDGVNVLSGETAAPHQGGYVLAPGARMDVRGWRKSLDDVAAFYFTSLGDSYAARTGRPANVGVIGVALFKRKAVEEPVPYSYNMPGEDSPRRRKSEPLPAPPSPQAGTAPRSEQESRDSLSRYAAPSAPLGTGHGRRETSPVRWVSFERSTSEPLEIVAIHYDSHANLLARGIISSPVAPRDPIPFPGFVADPPVWR